MNVNFDLPLQISLAFKNLALLVIPALHWMPTLLIFRVPLCCTVCSSTNGQIRKKCSIHLDPTDNVGTHTMRLCSILRGTWCTLEFFFSLVIVCYFIPNFVLFPAVVGMSWISCLSIDSFNANAVTPNTDVRRPAFKHLVDTTVNRDKVG